MIIGIVAVAKNNAIGKDGKLPWHYTEDLKFFKRTTMGHAILMGRKTWESIGRPLPGRLNVVLSRSAKIDDAGDAVVLNSVETALSLAEYLAGDLYVLGGAGTFEAFADKIDKWIVTEIPAEVEGADVFMPDDFLSGFEVEDRVSISPELDVTTYQRKRSREEREL